MSKLGDMGIGFFGKVNLDKLVYLYEKNDTKLAIGGFIFNRWGIVILRESKRTTSDFVRPTPIRDDEYPYPKSPMIKNYQN